MTQLWKVSTYFEAFASVRWYINLFFFFFFLTNKCLSARRRVGSITLNFPQIQIVNILLVTLVVNVANGKDVGHVGVVGAGVGGRRG